MTQYDNQDKTPKRRSPREDPQAKTPKRRHDDDPQAMTPKVLYLGSLTKMSDAKVRMHQIPLCLRFAVWGLRYKHKYVCVHLFICAVCVQSSSSARPVDGFIKSLRSRSCMNVMSQAKSITQDFYRIPLRSQPCNIQADCCPLTLTCWIGVLWRICLQWW